MASTPEITIGGITKRSHKVNVKFFIKPQEMSRINNALATKLSDNVYILTLNNAVYRVGAEVVPDGCDDKPRKSIQNSESRIRQISEKSHLARQGASRIQCEMRYETSGRPFSPKIKNIAAQLRQSLIV